MRIGIDIGGMSIKIGIVNQNNNIIARKVISTNSGKETQEQAIERIIQSVCQLAQENCVDIHKCDCVGVACPGTVDIHSGYVAYSNNLAWENLALKEMLEQHIKAPIAIANDADAAALGEVRCGAAKDKKNVILLTLGTGVGGGVVIDGQIFTGALRGGCELGHMVIQKNGQQCTCGRRGCLEQYASASALMNAARKAAKQNRASVLGEMCSYNYQNLTGKDIFEAARCRDAVAQAVVEKYEENLSIGIANLVNIFRPEIVILGGGIAAQGENLTRPIQSKVDSLCFGGKHGEIPRIVTSVLGNDAGIIGAAYLC